MKILANKDIRNLFLAVSVIWAASLLLAQGFLWLRYQRLSLCLLLIFLLAAAAIWVVCCSYFKKQNKIMEQAVSQINVYLDGDSNARIECDSEGELYRLFHSVNSLAAVLNAHADNELREKEFLKNTISDISHQLKTPLAALNIYNGLLQEEDIEASSVKEFAGLSEQELDRIETLVQSLLKITKLDAGSVILEKATEPNAVQIAVKDNGCGIHPEDLHHIFKRFYRSRFSQDKQGIGLGLPLAKTIVEAHSGTIEVDSELGKGTTFTMNFLIPTKL